MRRADVAQHTEVAGCRGGVAISGLGPGVRQWRGSHRGPERCGLVMLSGEGGQAGRQPLNLQVGCWGQRRQLGQCGLDVTEQTERLHAAVDDLVQIP